MNDVFEKHFEEFGFVSRLEIFNEKFVIASHPEDIGRIIKAEKMPSAAGDNLLLLKKYFEMRKQTHLNIGFLEARL